MTKQRHNKRRNTSFLFQILVREFAKSVIADKVPRQTKVLTIIKEGFSKGTELSKELALYKAILETSEIDASSAEKIMKEVQKEHKGIDPKKLYREQTKLISRIHNRLSKKVFSNFVPNYKDLATIYQVFNSKLPINKRVLLESQIVERLSSPPAQTKEDMKPISALSYKTFIKRFNEKYSTSLLKEQKQLLSSYILSFTDKGLQLKTFMNEELWRIRETLSSVSDEYKEKVNEILSVIDGFKRAPITEGMVAQVVRMQELVSELGGKEDDGN